MIAGASFIDAARDHGLDFYTGVPCSFLNPMINRVISDKTLDYVGAASEGEAVGIAAGAWLAGRGTVVMCQNSGLGNTVNPLTSLNWPFQIPTLLITTWRGQPGLKDEPQHELMGQITGEMLDIMRIPHCPFPKEDADIKPALDQARRFMDEKALPFGFIMEKESVADEGLDQDPINVKPACRSESLIDGHGIPDRPSRFRALEILLETIPEKAAVVATTGKCGRELFTLDDRDQHIYQVGSMGCASAMGLGAALNSERPIVVLDGDGAALMKMGSFATIGAYGPKNLIHIVLDNGVHDSTGGQATVSPGVDFALVAAACGYRAAGVTDNQAGFKALLDKAVASDGPWLIHLRTQPGSINNLGRPTVKPAEVARRFRNFMLSDRGLG